MTPSCNLPGGGPGGNRMFINLEGGKPGGGPGGMVGGRPGGGPGGNLIIPPIKGGGTTSGGAEK